MRNLKRALSLALASVMLLGMMVVGTSAASYPDVKDSDNVEAIEVLNAVGVMIGKKGKFDPDAPVNRHEMAAIMARLYLGEDAETYVGSHPFTDVYPWADKYVAACYENGLINGTSKTTYSGNQPLTAIQAAAMMLRALGYEDLSKGAADWRTPVAAKANQVRLFKDVTSSPNAQLTRNQVAQLALNTLKADVVETEKGSTVNVGGVEIVTSIKYNRVEITTETDNYCTAAAAGNAASTDTGYGYQQLCEKLYGNDLKLRGSNTDDLKRPASVWQYKKEDIIKVADEADYIFVLDDNYTGYTGGKTFLTEVIRELSNNDDLLYNHGTTPTATVASSTTNFYLNGATVAVADVETDIKAAAKYGTVVEVYLTDGNNNVIDKVVAYNYTLDKITEVDTDVKDSDAKKGVTAYVTFKNAGTFNDDKIAGYSASTYEKDAYVAVIEKDDGTEIIASYIPEMVSGSIDSVKSAESLTIDGSKRCFGVNYTSSSVEYVAAGSIKPGTDNEYEVYLDSNGYVLGVKVVEDAAAKLDEVYYVDTVWKETQGMDTRYYAQVVALADGTKKEVELEKKDNTALTSADLSSASYDGNNRIEGDKGKLATVTDKKETDSKAGNNKFNLKAWNTANGDDYDIYTGVKFTTDSKLKADDTRLAATNGTNQNQSGASDTTHTFRLSSTTKYVFLEKTAADLDVSTVTGGVNFTFSTANMGTIGTSAGETRPAIVITEDGKTVAQYVIIPCAKASSTTGASKDVIFIKSASSDKGDGYRIQEVYLPDGSKADWNIDEGEYDAGGLKLEDHNFFTYTENSDGYYELEKADAMTFTPGNFWDDEDGVLGNDTNAATIAADARMEADGKVYLTVTVGGNTLKEIDVTNAKFVDAHDKDGSGEYDRAINSLQRLCDLIDDAEDGKAGVNKTGTKLYLYVTSDGAQIIVLTDAPAKAATHTHVWGAWTVEGANHVRTCTGSGTCPDGNTQTHAATTHDTWVTTDGTKHWKQNTSASSCTIKVDEGNHDAAPTNGSATHVEGNDGTDDTHTWSCTCGKNMSENCPGTSSTACTACGYNKDTGKA